jgi:hypothetical protein
MTQRQKAAGFASSLRPIVKRALLEGAGARLGADAVATPSSCRTSTDHSLLVYRRSAKNSLRHPSTYFDASPYLTVRINAVVGVGLTNGVPVPVTVKV